MGPVPAIRRWPGSRSRPSQNQSQNHSERTTGLGLASLFLISKVVRAPWQLYNEKSLLKPQMFFNEFGSQIQERGGETEGDGRPFTVNDRGLEARAAGPPPTSRAWAGADTRALGVWESSAFENSPVLVV